MLAHQKELIERYEKAHRKCYGFELSKNAIEVRDIFFVLHGAYLTYDELRYEAYLLECRSK